jgi:murein tripeptide amidase MpaA
VVAVYSAIILADSPEQVSALREMKLDLHERAARRRPDSGDYAVPAILTDRQVEQLRADGYRVDVQEDAEQLAVERAAEVTPEVNRFAPAPADRTRERDQEAGPRTVPYEQEHAAGDTLQRLMDLSDPELDLNTTATSAGERAVLGGYLTADEVESALQTLAATYPEAASVLPLPQQTWGGVTSHVLQLRAGQQQARMGVLVMGGMHAREWGGSDICVAFATNLLRAYRAGRRLRYGNKTFAAADVRAILENLDVFVFADVNPDGKAYSQSVDPGQPQNFWWRKNRRLSGLPGGAQGVDLNRNFDFLWTSGIGTTADATQFTYKGPEPFSEPEARNVRWLLDTHDQIGYVVDVHSFGELILYSWGDDENQDDTPAQSFLNPAFDGVRGLVGDLGLPGVHGRWRPGHARGAGPWHERGAERGPWEALHRRSGGGALPDLGHLRRLCLQPSPRGRCTQKGLWLHHRVRAAIRPAL